MLTQQNGLKLVFTTLRSYLLDAHKSRHVFMDTVICSLLSQLFFAASVASLPLYGYFYPFCLLHIVVNNDILQRVLRSVTKNGE